MPMATLDTLPEGRLGMWNLCIQKSDKIYKNVPSRTLLLSFLKAKSKFHNEFATKCQLMQVSITKPHQKIISRDIYA